MHAHNAVLCHNTSASGFNWFVPCRLMPMRLYDVVCTGKRTITPLMTTCGPQYAASAWAWSQPSTNTTPLDQHSWTRQPRLVMHIKTISGRPSRVGVLNIGVSGSYVEC